MKKVNKILLVVVLILVILNVVGFSAYAIYTSVTKVKRVVSVQGGQGDLFSSNYLALRDKTEINDNNYTNVQVNYVEDNPVFYLSICNYAQGNISKHNTNDIKYSIRFSIEDTSGAPISVSKTYNGVSGATLMTSFSINDIDLEDYYTTLTNQVLSGSTISRNIYRIGFNKDYISLVKIKVYATPNDGYDYSAYALEGKISGSLTGNSQSASWMCSLVESASDEADVSKVYGFNYDITGTGSGSVTLTWNSTYLTISEYSLLTTLDLTYADVSSGTGTKSVTFSVSDKSYRIQFFRTENTNVDETWASIRNYVTVTFTEN